MSETEQTVHLQPLTGCEVKEDTRTDAGDQEPGQHPEYGRHPDKSQNQNTCVHVKALAEVACSAFTRYILKLNVFLKGFF